MHGLMENKDTGAKRGNEGFCLLCAGGDRFRSVKAAKVLQQATQMEPCADTALCCCQMRQPQVILTHPVCDTDIT